MKKIILLTTFIWIGFVSSISFMESWLKFQAPNITTKLGLGIGKLVFNALNTVEITFAIIISICLISALVKGLKQQTPYLFFIIILVLTVQTFWLLPALVERADLIINDVQVPKSNLHLAFGLLEILKIASLFVFGLNQMQKDKIPNLN
ncbi:MAG: hypothetical protein ACPG45_02055 [Flavobacteriaceae bacterium]